MALCAHFIRIQIHAFYLSMVHGDPQEWLKLKAFGVVKVNENIGSNVTDSVAEVEEFIFMVPTYLILILSIFWL